MKRTLQNRSVFISAFSILAILFSGYTVQAQVRTFTSANEISKEKIMKSPIASPVSKENKQISERGKKELQVSATRPQATKVVTLKSTSKFSEAGKEIKSSDQSKSTYQRIKTLPQIKPEANQDHQVVLKSAGNPISTGSTDPSAIKVKKSLDPNKARRTPANYDDSKSNMMTKN